MRKIERNGCEGKEKITLYTVELAKYEIANALLKGKELPIPQVHAALATIYSLPLTFVVMTEELARLTYSLAAEVKITYYDAAFLALAKTFKATLITDNIKHQGKASTIKVIPLSEYH